MPPITCPDTVTIEVMALTTKVVNLSVVSCLIKANS